MLIICCFDKFVSLKLVEVYNNGVCDVTFILEIFCFLCHFAYPQINWCCDKFKICDFVFICAVAGVGDVYKAEFSWTHFADFEWEVQEGGLRGKEREKIVVKYLICSHMGLSVWHRLEWMFLFLDFFKEVDKNLIDLQRWMKTVSFKADGLAVAEFKGTGRGLIAKKNLYPGGEDCKNLFK